ncbi:MAG: DUF3307 domain-containing protein [Akkermansiaceae bacterium]
MGSEFTTRLVAEGGLQGVIILAFALIIGHAFGDYPLQGEFLASGKNRNLDPTKLFGGAPGPPALWVHALTAHALIQAGIVWLITGSPILAAVELVAHWIIDFIRCERWISFAVDQALHIALKILYAILLVYGVL